MLVIITVIAANYAVPFLLRLAQQCKLQKYCNNLRILVLTYDDGPGTRLTSELLDLFDREQVKVTFFPLGFRALRNLGLVCRAKDAGHEVGFHGQNHINHWKVLPWEALNDINSGYKTFSKMLSVPILFRPPFGKLTLIPQLKLRKLKILVGWWTVVSGDTFEKLDKIDDVVDKIRRSNGGVVLMHDHDRRHDTYMYEQYVIELTGKLINMANANNLKIMKLGDVLQGIKHNFTR